MVFKNINGKDNQINPTLDIFAIPLILCSLFIDMGLFFYYLISNNIIRRIDMGKYWFIIVLLVFLAIIIGFLIFYLIIRPLLKPHKDEENFVEYTIGGGSGR